MARASMGTKDPNPYLVLVAVTVGVVMSVLDTTIVNVAIAKLQVALGESTDAVQWVITAYLLAFAVMLSASGWLADNLGYKRTFQFAVALFTLGSFFCSVSGSLTTLVLSRILQGIGGGLLGPTGMAILTRAFPRERMGMVMAFFSVPTIAFTSFGPTLGGWLIDNFSWQTMFDVNIPVGIAAFFLCTAILKEYKKAGGGTFDAPGFLAMGLAMAFLLFALSNGNAGWNTDGWTSPLMMTCFGVSFAGFALFAVFQRTTNHPLLDFTLFQSYNFTLATIVIFVFGLGIFGSDFLLPLYLQTGLGYTPTQAGSIFLPFGLVMIVTGIVGGRLTDRVGPRIPGLVGVAIRAFGMYRFTFLTPSSSNAEVLLTVCLLGAGMGFLMSPMQTAALRAIPVEKTAQATGLIQVMRQIGGSLGVALLSTILVSRETFHVAALSQSTSAGSVYRQTQSQLLYHSLSAGGGTTADALGRAHAIVVSKIRTDAFVAAIDDVFFITLIISVLSSLPFLFLKSIPRIPKDERAAKSSNDEALYGDHDEN